MIDLIGSEERRRVVLAKAINLREKRLDSAIRQEKARVEKEKTYLRYKFVNFL